VPWWISRWRIDAPLWGIPEFRGAGVALLIAGLAVLLDSFARFAFQGLGSPAPIFPTRRLVVDGLYGYVRNPIYIAVVAMIVGQGVLFGNIGLLEYATVVGVGFHVFVIAYEEPKLRATFGATYDVFYANVPRWLPRLRPWRANAMQS